MAVTITDNRTLVLVGLYDWKRFMEGIRRGDVGPYIQKSIILGKNSCRQYTDKELIIATMLVPLNNNTNNSDIREFRIRKSDIDKVSYIFIPTDEDIEFWSDNDLDIENEINIRESGAYK